MDIETEKIWDEIDGLVNEYIEGKNMKNQIVIVTTAHKGVFCGKLISEDVDIEYVVVLQDAKMAVYWCPEVHGVLGLAKMGPIKGCRISPAVKEIKLLGVTSITICSEEAIENWKKERWD